MNEQATSSISTQDRISALPDEIIPIILSQLHVEESARTSILSKRWCKMWLFSPITISDESLIKQSCIYSTQEKSSSWMVNAMSHIISTHPGPVHTCHFSLSIWDEHHETLAKLLRILTQKGIRNLLINCAFDHFFDVPCFVFECKSLVNVELCKVWTPDQVPTGRNILPNLRKLTLAFSYVIYNFLDTLLHSTSITELKLSECIGFGDVVIESDSLQKVYFLGSPKEYVNPKLIIKDAPNLESLKCDDLTYDFKLVILNAPKLKVLSCIDMETWMFQLGNYWFKFHKKCMKINGEITYMPSVRSLYIRVNFDGGYEAKSIPHFLKCFPCLETLKLQMIGTRDAYSGSDSSSDDEYGNNANDDAAIVVDDDYDNHVYSISNVDCLNRHLKNIRVIKYSGIEAHLDFVKLITANARVLETVTMCYDHRFKEELIEPQRQFLMRNGASKLLRVEFLEKK